jgi:Tol biopolymer transport system component
MDPDGSDARKVAAGELREYLPSWSPDGTQLAYWKGRGGRQGLEVMRWDPEESVDGVEVTWVGGTHDPPIWSPDGASLAIDGLLARATRDQVAVVSTAGDRKVTDGAALHPSWAPDGDSVAFFGSLGTVSERDSPDFSGLIVAKSDLRDPVQIGEAGLSAADHEAGVGPAWSPDGDWIVIGTIGSGGHDLIAISPDGTESRPIATSDEDEILPEWSRDPDRGLLAFLRGRDAYRLVLTDAEGSIVREFDGPGLTPVRPTWSPDGRRILVFGQRPPDDGGGSLGLIYEVVGSDPPLEFVVDGDVSGASWQAIES